MAPATAHQDLRLKSIQTDLEIIPASRALNSTTMKFKEDAPHDLLKNRCLSEWQSMEHTIRRSPIPDKFLDLPPALLLPKPRYRLLTVHWLFHRFPRDPSGIREAHGSTAAFALDKLHMLLSKSKLDRERPVIFVPLSILY